MKIFVLLLALVNIATAQKAQNQPNVQAETSGICSPVIQGNQGKVEFTCNTAMDEAMRKKFLRLLNQIVKNTKDTNATNKKLDDIFEYLTQFQATGITQGAGSIAQIGGTGNSATVINTRPALPHASWQTIQNFGNAVRLRIGVDKAYPGAMFAVVCDRPCEPTAAEIDWGQSRPRVEFGPEVRYGHPNNPDPLLSVAAFKVDFPAVLTPEYGVLATVKSADGTPLAIREVDTLTLTGR